MATTVKWHLEVLPPPQKALWQDRLSHGLSGWTLYGGTALALQLGHRISIDFDFFSSESFDPLVLNQTMGWEGDILHAEPNTLTVIHQGVKLLFFGKLSLGVLVSPQMLGSCPVASLDDLGGCKLAALVNRVELKDYLDILALLRHGRTLSHLLGCANAIYHGRFPIAACLKSLAWFDDPALAGLNPKDRQTLEQAVLSVKKIPTLELVRPNI